MSKVGIADLKAHLSQYLRKERGGRTITVLDRDTPVAQIVPYDAVEPDRQPIRSASGPRVEVIAHLDTSTLLRHLRGMRGALLFGVGLVCFVMWPGFAEGIRVPRDGSASRGRAAVPEKAP